MVLAAVFKWAFFFSLSNVMGEAGWRFFGAWMSFFGMTMFFSGMMTFFFGMMIFFLDMMMFFSGTFVCLLVRRVVTSMFYPRRRRV